VLVKYVVSKSIVSYRTGINGTYIVLVGHNDNCFIFTCPVNPLLTVTRSEIACVRVVGKCGVL
jgi:hypothetical protein